MKTLIGSVLFSLLVLGSTAWGGDRAGWPEVVRFGAVPIEGGADTTLRYGPLVERLSRELGVRVEVVSAASYQAVITAMGNRQLEFAHFGPKSYIEAARRADAEALVVELNADGEPGYRCIFIVPRGSPVQSLEDARGMRFAFVDPNSTSGWLIPAMILLDRLKMPAERYFAEVLFSGSHATSVLQVAAGEVDVAATNDLDFARMIQRGAVRATDVRVIYRSELIPGAPVAARRDVPESLKRAMSDALQKVKDDPKLLELLQCGGFVPASDDMFDIIRAADEFVREMEREKNR